MQLFRLLIHAVHENSCRGEHIQRFQDGARALPEIVECHHVTGTFDYLLRVEVADLAASSASTPINSPHSTTSASS